ncbi:MAG: hypothetical protein H7061_11370, partial [Bdellovibrionaceae bacterium]|nr:hypothetical protein [Bdellovibrio sp.]
MFKKIFYFKKAAVINAAFFIFSSLADARLVLTTFDSVRSKASLLLLQKQKKQAMAVVSDYIANETNKVAIAEASDFLLMISKTFLSKEAQEAYETSINLTSDNSKESLQQVEVCLQLEPQNAECLIQRLRLAVRLKNKSLNEKTMAILEEAIPGTIVENWAALIVKKHEPDFKSKSIVKKLTEKPSEDVFVLTTLELDRAFEVNNFSRA